MMISDTAGNETGDGGESDGEGDEMILLDCIKNKSFEEMLEHNLTQADVDAYDEGAIPSAPKNWQPPQPPSNFKPCNPKVGAPPWERVDNPGTHINQSIQKDNIWTMCNCSSSK